MTVEAAFLNFWSSFLIPAYEENTVPENAQFPYLTYQVASGNFGNEIPLTASVWFRGTSWIDANAKAREIKQGIGQGGIILDCDDGKIWIKRGEPFSQNMGDLDDDLIKRKNINVTAEFLTVD